MSVSGLRQRLYERHGSEHARSLYPTIDDLRARSERVQANNDKEYRAAIRRLELGYRRPREADTDAPCHVCGGSGYHPFAPKYFDADRRRWLRPTCPECEGAPHA